MAKMKNNMFFVNAEFYRVIWTINALLIVRSEMLQFSGNNQKHRNVQSPPEHISMGMYIMIICNSAILHYNMSFKTIARRSDGVFWWFPALSEDQEEINCRIHQNYLVVLRLGYILLPSQRWLLLTQAWNIIHIIWFHLKEETHIARDGARVFA